MGRGGRILAAAFAAIWLATGLTALAIGLWLRPAIVPVLVSPLALGYGWIWARVAVTGRRQEWPRGADGNSGADQLQPGSAAWPAHAADKPERRAASEV